MKIRLISDLHIDINKNYPLDLHEDGANDVYTLVAGDISGNPEKNVEWLKKNIHQGAFICGNHDVYDTDMPIEEVKDFYHKAFPDNSNIVFFDNDVGIISKEISDGIMLVADVLYTDFALPIDGHNPKGDIETNMSLVDPYKHPKSYLNDFNYGKCKKMFSGWNDSYASKSSNDVFRLVPPWYLEHHKKAFAKITEIIEKNEDKQIILMAHHGLSPKCLDSSYNEPMTNAAYASDKEEWIKSHPNIKCIVSGHIHARKKFNVGDCLYVMNSLGYCKQHLTQFLDFTGKNEMWTPNCFIDTDAWTVEWIPYENEIWKNQEKKDNDAFSMIMNAFI